MRPVLVIICFVLVFILVITSSAAIIFQGRLVQCNSAKNPWCYTDWKCLSEDGLPINRSPLTGPDGIVARCTPITAERAAQLNARGCRNLYPGSAGERQWPNCRPKPLLADIPPNGTGEPARCEPAIADTCPVYMTGDIDWTAETGCKPAKGYVPLE